MTELMTNVDYDKILRADEKTELRLRALFESEGFRQYRMSKFEEYDLYADKKDFLPSSGILSFTDTTGRLMALKPDVTLSIVRNTRFDPYLVEKIYYSENVYRAKNTGDGFREIRQLGIECMGDIRDEDISGSMLLAAKSLGLISGDYALSISHMGFVLGLLEEAGLSEEQKQKALGLIQAKNTHELEKLFYNAGTFNEARTAADLAEILSLSGPVDIVLSKLREKNVEEKLLSDLSSLAYTLAGSDQKEKIRFDFSVVNDISYYNGLVMKGFVEGVPEAVLSGGEYDLLLRKMGINSRAVGFCIYMDFLRRFLPEEKESKICAGTETAFTLPGTERTLNPPGATGKTVPVSFATLNIALPKGRLGEKILDIFEKAGLIAAENRRESRKLVLEGNSFGLRFFWVKPSDVAIYVERGAADIGIAGKDIILEYEPDVYELLHLSAGRCFLAEAAPEGFSDDQSRTKRVATKYENTARAFYSSKGRDIDIIRLNGSIELAPILKLSDVIVDIVETGTTLRENNLTVTEKIVDISARLIANKSSFLFKKDRIEEVLQSLRETDV